MQSNKKNVNEKCRFQVKYINDGCLPQRMTALKMKGTNIFIVKEGHKENQQKCNMDCNTKDAVSHLLQIKA